MTSSTCPRCGEYTSDCDAACRLSATPWAVAVGKGGKVLARFARRVDAVTFRSDEQPVWEPRLLVVRDLAKPKRG